MFTVLYFIYLVGLKKNCQKYFSLTSRVLILSNIWILNIEINILKGFKWYEKCVRKGIAHLATLKYLSIYKLITFVKTLQRLKLEWQKSPAGTRQTRRQKLGLVWRNRMNISQIINDYLCLPFFLLIILWGQVTRYNCNTLINSIRENVNSHACQVPCYTAVTIWSGSILRNLTRLIYDRSSHFPITLSILGCLLCSKDKHPGSETLTYTDNTVYYIKPLFWLCLSNNSDLKELTCK